MLIGFELILGWYVTLFKTITNLLLTTIFMPVELTVSYSVIIIYLELSGY